MKTERGASKVREVAAAADSRGRVGRFSQRYAAVALISLALLGCGGEGDGTSGSSAGTQAAANAPIGMQASQDDIKHTQATDNASATAILNNTFAIVFSGGGTYSTSINTDGGQFARLFGQYLSYGGVGVQ